jgi:hypothetical protein
MRISAVQPYLLTRYQNGLRTSGGDAAPAKVSSGADCWQANAAAQSIDDNRPETLRKPRCTRHREDQQRVDAGTLDDLAAQLANVGAPFAGESPPQGERIRERRRAQIKPNRPNPSCRVPTAAAGHTFELRRQRTRLEACKTGRAQTLPDTCAGLLLASIDR